MSVPSVRAAARRGVLRNDGDEFDGLIAKIFPGVACTRGPADFPWMVGLLPRRAIWKGHLQMRLREPDDNSRRDIMLGNLCMRWNVDSQNPDLLVVELFMKEAGFSSGVVHLCGPESCKNTHEPSSGSLRQYIHDAFNP